MSKEKEIGLLLKILQGDSKEQYNSESFNMDVLIRLAIIHKVVYHLLLFAQQHAEFFSQEQMTRLENHCRQAALRSLTQLHELRRIAMALQENRVDFVVIKGPQLSRMLYGREALKESVDLDIMLLNPGDFDRAHAVIRDLGYTRSNLDGFSSRFTRKLFIHAKREVAYSSPVTRNNIDLHVKPGSNTYLTARLFRDFFSGLVSYDLEGTAMPVLPPEKYFAYLCYHGSLHQFSRLAWLLDIRAFLRLKKDDLDYAKLNAISRSWHTERGLYTALRLLQAYFGDIIPEKLNDYPLFTPRINHLVKMCSRIIRAEESYSLSLKGRIDRFLYMMLMIRGLAGKVDFVYGILIRIVAGVFRKS
ncbi:MAG: nucleotidyltransferase family protein [Bacteroidales bacterium]|nr:nucleotidyltransferase family protein [Bacteroidales bacterium]